MAKHNGIDWDWIFFVCFQKGPDQPAPFCCVSHPYTSCEMTYTDLAASVFMCSIMLALFLSQAIPEFKFLHLPGNENTWERYLTTMEKKGMVVIGPTC